MATPERRFTITAKSKQSPERDLVVGAIPNMLLRNRAHAYLARTVLGWGLSQREANLFAGLHHLIKEKAARAHTFTNPQHVDALLHDLTKGKVNLVIPEKAHEIVKENGNGLADYLEDIKQDGDAGYAQYLRKERKQIPYNLREAGTAYLGKFLKGVPLDDTENIIAKNYINALIDANATNHFRVVKADDLLGALDGNADAKARVQTAIANAAAQTPLGKRQAAEIRMQQELNEQKRRELEAAIKRQLRTTKGSKLKTAIATALITTILATPVGYMLGTKSPQAATRQPTKQEQPGNKTPERQLSTEELFKSFQEKNKKLFAAIDKRPEMSSIAGSHSAFANRFVATNAEEIKREIMVKRGKLPPEDSPVKAIRHYLDFAKFGPLKSDPDLYSRSKTERMLGVAKEWADAIDLAASKLTPEEIDAFLSSDWYSPNGSSDAKQSGQTINGAIRLLGIPKYGRVTVPDWPKPPVPDQK